ncbi:hypothetical protein [Comamonas sp. JC664]|uniref:hypothetical protein n=1 Tax=Comamonas sp. JC664 TaxID=2801917 RepID=UPI00174C4237|nr:hypothetical protein [Comamonas sp. JC664]MBL0697095.1 hypothetical protein [Comamonas sp. JC664]GHG82472.1 hypothetical protein GCM10012319_36610 [Comamonas sp. KCTC 72670]
MVELIEDVLPWFAAFFILDAVVQLRRGQVVFNRTGWGRFQLLGSGLHLAGALPFGAALTAYDLPFLPTREGVWVFNPDARETPSVVGANAVSFLSWAALGDIQAEGTLLKGAGRVLLRARAPGAARTFAADLVRLRDTPADEREAEVDRWLRRRGDVAEAQARWKRVRLPGALAGVLGTLEALVLFGLFPVLAFVPGAAQEGDWERAVALLGCCHLGTLIAAAWALVRSGTSAGEVTSTLGVLLIYPVYTARAGIHVSRDVLADFEPLACAAVLMPRAGFMRLARRELVRTDESRDATRPLSLTSFWDARSRALTRLLEAAGTSAQEVLAPPAAPTDVAAWCPLCLTEYRSGFPKCADCGIDVALRP